MKRKVKIQLQNRTKEIIPFYLFGDPMCLSRTGNLGLPYEIEFQGCDYLNNHGGGGYQGLVMASLEKVILLINAKANVRSTMLITPSLHPRNVSTYEEAFVISKRYRSDELNLRLNGDKRLFFGIAPNQELRLTLLFDIL